jgi:hypothetical protein
MGCGWWKRLGEIGSEMVPCGAIRMIGVVLMQSGARAASEGHAYFEVGGVPVGGVAADGDELCNSGAS